MADLNIIDTVDPSFLEEELSSLSDRYYEHKYCHKIGNKIKIHQRISFHSNRLVMLSLAENHPIIDQNLTIKKVNFSVGNNIDRLKNEMSGKGKRGAQKLTPESIICILETDSGDFPVYSCIKGKLIEINEHLIENPELLKEKPVSHGYIALILPILSSFDDCKKNMSTKNEYIESCQI